MTTIGQLVLSGLLIGGIYALMSIGLTLIFGVLRIVNFAHGEFLMIAMYGAWAMTRYLGLNPYYAIVAIVPAMFLFGVVVHRLIVMPALDKPHLVVVFATMGLSILMQNVALMALSADLQDVPPILGGRSVHLRPVLRQARIAHRLCRRARLHARAALHVAGDLSRQGDPRHRAGRGSGAADGRSRAAHLSHHLRRRLRPGRSLRLRHDAFVLGVSDGGLNFVLIAFVIVVLGGMGSIEGALLGGICIGIVQSLSSYYIAPAFGQMFFFMLFLLVMIFRPAGLLGRKGEATLGIND
jgi:branched-chain amino acid transport system permease protein